MPRKVEATDWNPGLLHDELVLADVLGSLPGYGPGDVPYVIRLFENPSSRWALPGAITLARHDVMHAALGRGVDNEDEAFVVGYTMGASDGVENAMTRLMRATAWPMRGATQAQRNRHLRDRQIALYEFVARRIYRGAARFSQTDLIAFRLGLDQGEQARVRNLEDLPMETWGERTLGEVRRAPGIDRNRLEAVYRVERTFACTSASGRLDTGPEIDHAHIDPSAGRTGG